MRRARLPAYAGGARGRGRRGLARSSDRAARLAVSLSRPWCDLPNDRLTADVAAGPPANDGREEPSAATAVHDQNAAGAELRQGGVAQMLGNPLGDAAGAAH